jgi:uncharacterized membrane protein
MVAASIALVAQTYNIPGDMPLFILTWMLLIVPLTYLIQITMPAIIYMVGVSVWVTCVSLNLFLFWPLFLLLLPIFLVVTSKI